VKQETTFRTGQVIPFLKTLKNTHFRGIQAMAARGIPDFLLCSRGRFIGLELKTDTGKVDPLQEYELKQIEKCGGVAIVARPNNWASIKALLKKLDEGDDIW